MKNKSDRRAFLTTSAQLAAGLCLTRAAGAQSRPPQEGELFSISLAEWSLHRALFSKQLDHLDFARVAKQEYGISAVEYVNQFFKDKTRDQKYLDEMKKRASDVGVKSR